MNKAVEDTEVVCCFVTPEYQDSIHCKNELQYAKEKKKDIIPCMIGDEENKNWKPTDWLQFLTADLPYIDFREDSDSNIRLKTDELIHRITNQSTIPSQYNLIQVIKEKYLQENQIKRVLNKEETFPIEQSCINLATIKTKEHQKKERELTKHEVKNTSDPGNDHCNDDDSEILGTFEEIYADKTPVYLGNFFQEWRGPIKKVLVLGRPGMGKSTFCQYVTYRWAKGALWSQYELVILIDLQKLTHTCYPGTKLDAPVDLVQSEYALFGGLSNEERDSFQQKCNAGKVLWILDGYDAFAPNLPEQLKQCLDNIRNQQHHILTSSSHGLAISYHVKMEMMGFTNDDIPKYVKQFFGQLGGQLANVSSQGQKLLNFLHSNRSSWVIAHIPVNLELICTLWARSNWSETRTLTMSAFYDDFIEWLCRRQLRENNENQSQMTKEDVYKQYEKELQFLEHLAFKAMQNGKIILSSNFLQEIERETGCYLHEHPRLLEMGILKSYDNENETRKEHYFVHLSYEEYFAARYLLKTLKSSNNSEAIHLIKQRKYDQRFRLVLVFAAGLLLQSDYQSCTDIFWTTIQEEPVDLIGLQHFQLLTQCIDQLGDSNVFAGRFNLLEKLCISFNTFLNMKADVIKENVVAILAKTHTIPHSTLIQDNLAQLLLINDQSQKRRILSLISQFPVLQPTEKLFSELLRQLKDSSSSIRAAACSALGNIDSNTVSELLSDGLVNALRDGNAYVGSLAGEALGKLGENAVTNKVVAGLIDSLCHNADHRVHINACNALVKLSEKEATNLVIDSLIHALTTHKDFNIRYKACEALGEIAEKAATNEVVAVLLNAFRNQSCSVSSRACEALVKLGEKALKDEVITDLIKTLRDKDLVVRSRACEVLGSIDAKATTNEVIAGLINVLRDETEWVRKSAYKALVNLGENAATNELIAGLIEALRDKNSNVRINACEVFVKVNEKIATNEVLAALVKALSDKSESVRKSACEALGKIGEKKATKEVIAGLVNALHDKDSGVRKNAGEALAKMGEKAATTEVISALIDTLRDRELPVQNMGCETLAKLAKVAATNEVIARLIDTFRDERYSVRENVCKTLGNIGEKAATNEVIAFLINALGDKHWIVRTSAGDALVKLAEKAVAHSLLAGLSNALGDANKDVRHRVCLVLKEIGEKAATKEMIAALVNALSDEDSHVQSSACYALQTFGKRVVSNELIAGLIEALRDKNSDVRRYVWCILRWIGDKAGTKEMIAALVTTLRDEDESFRSYACEAFRQIGKKAATEEVIAYLINALGDNNSDVREKACKALGNMGEKARTNEALAALVNALRDKDLDVRESACKALGKLGEKAATNEVLLGLVNALRDNKNYKKPVREEACKALGKMGEKAARNDVVGGLVKALGEKEWDVDIRGEVCETLAKIGEKAARNEVLGALINAIRDKDWQKSVGGKASDALAKIGEKVVTNEMITDLINALLERDYIVEHCACVALVKLGEKAKTNQVIVCSIEGFLDKINDEVDPRISAVFAGALHSYDAIKDLDTNMIRKLDRCLKQCMTIDLAKIPSDQFIGVFLETRNDAWIPLLRYAALMQNVAVTVMENKIIINHGIDVAETHVAEPEVLDLFVSSLKTVRSDGAASS